MKRTISIAFIDFKKAFDENLIKYAWMLPNFSKKIPNRRSLSLHDYPGKILLELCEFELKNK